MSRQVYRKIGYLGPEGTFTEAAVKQLLRGPRQGGATLTPVDDILSLLKKLHLKQFDAVVTPLTNTIAGEYEGVREKIIKYHLKEIDRVTLEIHLAIGIHPKSTRKRIHELRSKDTALEECSDYLDHSFPKAKPIAVSSTAAAIRQIMVETLLEVAAIGSEDAMRRYGLQQIDTRIENRNNFTTFVLLARK